MNTQYNNAIIAPCCLELGIYCGNVLGSLSLGLVVALLPMTRSSNRLEIRRIAYSADLSTGR